MPPDATDERQLLGATAQQRCLFTYNIRDFAPLARQIPQHGGIILAAQTALSLGQQIQALDRLLSETEAADWLGQIRWLNDWLSR
jgi:hypothetical protein